MYKKHKKLLFVIFIIFLVVNIFQNLFHILKGKDIEITYIFYDEFEYREKDYEKYNVAVITQRYLVNDSSLSSAAYVENHYFSRTVDNEHFAATLPKVDSLMTLDIGKPYIQDLKRVNEDIRLSEQISIKQSRSFDVLKHLTQTYNSITKVILSPKFLADVNDGSKTDINDGSKADINDVSKDNINNGLKENLINEAIVGVANTIRNEGDNLNGKNKNMTVAVTELANLSIANPALAIIELVNVSAIDSEPEITTNNITATTTTSKSNTITIPAATLGNESFEKVNVYYYDDICSEDTYGLTWHPLFPKFPINAELRRTIDDDRFSINTKSFRRITGYLSPLTTDWYVFELSARLGAELILTDKYENFSSGIVLDKFLLRTKISKDQVFKEEKLLGKWDLFKAYSEPVLLESRKKYLYDITHVWSLYGMLLLKWKTLNGTVFTSILPECLTPLYKTVTTNPVLPNILYFNKTTNEIYFQQDLRNAFFKTDLLNLSLSLNECSYSPMYIPKDFPPDYGTAYVKIDSIYPDNRLLRNHGKHANVTIPLIDHQKAEEIRKMYLGTLNGNYAVSSIVHIEENHEQVLGKRYFVELDVKKGDSIYRSSGWIFRYKNGSLCKPSGYSWNPTEKVYLLTPIKNQHRWLQFLIHSINGIAAITGEKNLHLIVVDFDSNDLNVSKVLSTAEIPYTLLTTKGNFSKVKGLNLAVKSIVEDDALMFVLDLHLQLPLFIFDNIRKHTFKGLTTYVPVMLRLGCGQHPFYTEIAYGSIWQEIGYGMISIFKSDWNKIGGMDEKRFGEKWGGEDWELIDRILKNKIEVIHHRIPGYYHLYHSTKGTWDGTKLF